MHARLVIADFDAHTAAVAIEPSSRQLPPARIRDMIETLSDAGMRKIEVRIDPRTPEAGAQSVRAILEGSCALVCEGRHASAEPRGNRVFQRASGEGAADVASSCLYEACFESLSDVVVRSASFVALVRVAAGLDSSIAGRLRFAVNELVANAVDHASFGGPPRIELAVAASAGHTLLVYRDNAAPFSTASPPNVDVARKIALGERRGLGLFMLNRMAQQVRHRHHGDWNETTVLFVSAASSLQPGSSAMDGFKLEQTPCHLPNILVLKPIGSIDSNSVQVLDAKLNTVASRAGAQVVIDLSSVTFVSSAGVGAFLGTVSQLRSTGGDLIFMNPPAVVMEVFEIINLAAYFRIVASLDELQPAAQR